MNIKLKFLVSFISVFLVITLAVCFVSIVLDRNGGITPPVSVSENIVLSETLTKTDESFFEASTLSDETSDLQGSSSKPQGSSSKPQSSSSKPQSSSSKPQSSSSKPQGSSSKPQSSSSKPQDSSTPEIPDNYQHIMGKSVLTAEQMVSYVIKNQNGSLANIKLTCSLYELASYYLDEGAKEGVRGDIAFMQAIVETGWFTYPATGAVTYEQNNFCGLGVTGEIDPATGQKVKGEYFDNARIGVRAQIQHLKGYATNTPLVNECVDKRYKYIEPKGRANDLWSGLNMAWSMTADYSVKILNKYQEAKATDVNSAYVALAKTKNPK